MDTTIPLILLLLAIFYLYFARKEYLRESFRTDIAQGAELINKTNAPYSDIPVNNLEEYDDPRIDYILTPGTNGDNTEADVVMGQEGDYTKQESDFVKNERRNRMQFDYPQLPPISLTRQIEQAKHSAYLASNPAPISAGSVISEGFASTKSGAYPRQGFTNLGEGFTAGTEFTDKQKLEEEERKILATYVPKNSSDLLSYAPEDAEDLIKKVYTSKGLVPSYKQRKDGIWEVYETKEINPKIVWEDDIQRDVDRLATVEATEQTIMPPNYANRLASGLDPFFEPRTTVRANRNDYMRWTPGLERMFAPTDAVSGPWY